MICILSNDLTFRCMVSYSRKMKMKRASTFRFKIPNGEKKSFRAWLRGIGVLSDIMVQEISTLAYGIKAKQVLGIITTKSRW